MNKFLGIMIMLLFFVGILGVLNGIKKAYELDQCTKEKTILEFDMNKWKMAYIHINAIDLKPAIKSLQPKLDEDVIEKITNSILRYSSEYRLPPYLVVHLIYRESGFNILATSHAGAKGLMQIIPKWHEEKLKKLEISDNDIYYIENNIRLGCWILRDYFDETGDIEKTLKKYVGGDKQDYINDILVGFTNSAIIGVKNVRRLQEIDRGERDIETQTEPERSGEHEEESSNTQNSSTTTYQ